MTELEHVKRQKAELQRALEDEVRAHAGCIAALKNIRNENERAKRQFTNVSNKLIEDACKVLDDN